MPSHVLGSPTPFLILPAAARPEQFSDEIRLAPGEGRRLLDVAGPTCVRRLRLGALHGRLDPRAVLRAYWDLEPEPSLELPIGALLDDAPSLDIRLPMPFELRGRIELHAGEAEPLAVWYSVEWETFPAGRSAGALRLHAAWRRESPAGEEDGQYLILDTVGKGYFLGAEVRALGETEALGALTYWLDGESEPGCLREWNLESSFDRIRRASPDGSPGPGLLLLSRRWERGLPFNRSLNLRLGCRGADVESAAFWFQEEPHRRFTEASPLSRAREQATLHAKPSPQSRAREQAGLPDASPLSRAREQAGLPTDASPQSRAREQAGLPEASPQSRAREQAGLPTDASPLSRARGQAGLPEASPQSRAREQAGLPEASPLSRAREQAGLPAEASPQSRAREQAGLPADADRDPDAPFRPKLAQLPSLGSWWLCGPFNNVDDRAMRTVLPMELERDFDPADIYPTWLPDNSPWGPRAETRWVRRRDVHGFIDFQAACGPPIAGYRGEWPAVAVALSTIQLRANSRATLHVAWSNEIQIRVNETVAFGPERQERFTRREIPVSLRSGANRILIKLSNSRGLYAGNWAFAFRAVLPDGTEVSPAGVP